MADEDELWSFDVEGVSRIVADLLGDDDVTYAVTFNLTGPDANAEVEVLMTAPSDPAGIIALALATLHAALAAWARITLGRRIADDDG